MKKTLLALIAFVGSFSGSVFAQPSGSPAEPSWNKLSAAYADPGVAPSVTSVAVPSDDALVERLTFMDEEGNAVKGLFIRPKAQGVYPVLVMLHGLGGNKEQMVKPLQDSILSKGVAIFALDAPSHGERSTKESAGILMQMFFAAQKSPVKGDLVAQIHAEDKNDVYAEFLTHIVHEGVKDYRLGLDYLASRKDVDSKRIGLLGYSLGSVMGSILVGVDSRISSAALCVGGDPVLPIVGEEPAGLQDEIREAACSLFIGHAAGRPILMLNGTQDTVISKPATERLYEAAAQPKEIRWFESGHTLPKQALVEAVDWSESHLKP